MATATLLLGSNRGNREEILEKAVSRIHSLAGEVKQVSSLYESEPWGFTDAVMFLNQVVIVETALGPKPLLKQLLEIERLLGRKRIAMNAVYSSRPIDIDILFYDDLVINDANLQVPHPRMHNRMFTMLPLTEIQPEMLHPVLKKQVHVLTKECPDQLQVNKLRPTEVAVKDSGNEL